MRDLDELLAVDDPAMLVVREWIDAGRVEAALLPPEPGRRERCLVGLQVTVRSVLGALAYETGGLLVDHGWLRLLGGGHGTLPSLYEAAQVDDARSAKGHLVLGWDVVGGVFALDTGDLGHSGRVCYYAPDSLQWDDLGLGHAEFVEWVLSGGLSTLAEDLRWEGWREQAAGLRLDEAYLVEPPLWTRGRRETTETSRRRVPVAELLAHQARAARVPHLSRGHRPGLTTRFGHR
ncbi:MAG TPA: DUF2625 family protein [Propionibacteriaceae bacterium]|nr:DUF2625 family protein [Propionibacteriaceae bacterium]